MIVDRFARTAGLVLAGLLALGTAHAAEPQECRDVGIANVNWTGVSVKSDTAQRILQALGYKTTLTTASVPIAFQAVASGERDFFLGLWLPTQQSMIKPFLEKDQVEQVVANLEGAKYTLAVPTYVWEAGVKSFSDLDKYKDKFDGRILGIEAGNDGNQIIQSMIDKDAFGLGDWQLMPSSEAGMLTQVKRSTQRDEWAVFLGWAPHPMNLNIDMKYLTGGADFFGPDQGGATVYTIATTGYTQKCANVGRFLKQYTYSVEEQSRAGGYVINQDIDTLEAGVKLIQEKPELLDRWLSGVKTADGEQDAIPAVKKALEMQ
ncbi:choline ABC transporter substrate-binding protein [Ectothiorhodospiraceae bacterium WFHF3C12]|nr:choline ABC transporter substrate-binding protein [Ectothiorhodospiraceae bacterium WFHF3C12]